MRPGHTPTTVVAQLCRASWLLAMQGAIPLTVWRRINAPPRCLLGFEQQHWHGAMVVWHTQSSTRLPAAFAIINEWNCAGSATQILG